MGEGGIKLADRRRLHFHMIKTTSSETTMTDTIVVMLIKTVLDTDEDDDKIGADV